MSPTLSLWRRVVVRFSWEVGDFLPKRKGKGALYSRVMTCSSIYIAKLPLSSAFDHHHEGYVRDSWVVTYLAKGGQPATFLKMVASQEGLRSGIMSSARLRKYVWARFFK